MMHPHIPRGSRIANAMMMMRLTTTPTTIPVTSVKLLAGGGTDINSHGLRSPTREQLPHSTTRPGPRHPALVSQNVEQAPTDPNAERNIIGIVI